MKIINNPFSFLRSRFFVNLLLLPIITQLTTKIPTSFAMNMFENISLSTMEIIQNNGYSVEVHEVVTQDGYILELHRIPMSKNGQKPTRNHPVFIHHGILGSSADWVLGGADISMPLQLADAGYDVWMANCRGNTYSRKHVSMNSKQKAYWNFSLHEIGKYDLPASIDYILINTNTLQLHYIGFSMGTCVFFIMGSERPEYQPKIRSQISLAPVAFLSNTRSSLRYIAPYAKILNIMFQRMSKGMLLPQSKFQSLIANTVCREKMTQKFLCEKCMIFSVCGSDPYNFNSKLIPLIMGHFPAGTSSKLSAHFAQFILKDTFGQYDYGSTLNMQHYNSTEPPTYNLKSIKVPITLIHGENDILADTEDVMRLKMQLPKVVDAYAVPDPYFNHVDFLWSLRVNELVNGPIRDSLRTTDDPNWSYSGPSPRAFAAGNRPAPRPPQPAHNPKFVPALEYFAENLDAIIASTMPASVDEKDAEAFERERRLQKLLFGDAIRFAVSAGEKYGRFRDDVTNEVSDWTDGVRTGVMSGVDGARDAVSSAGRSVAGGVAKAESAVVDGVAKAESAVVDGVAKAESAVTGGVAKARSAVVDSMAKAESAVVGGVAKAKSAVVGGAVNAERFVVGGVARAEDFVVGGVSKAGSFVHHGVNHVDRAVGTALDTTFKALNKALWFVK